MDNSQSPESAGTPIAHGGWKYHHTIDGPDFDGFTADELRALEAERGYDFADHPDLAG